MCVSVKQCLHKTLSAEMEMAKGRSRFTSKLHTPPIGDSSNMASEVPAATTSPAECNTSNGDNNSQESSPNPAQQQLNSSVDSGIAVLETESPTMRRRQRLHQCQRILQVLQRDQLTHQQLRDRLSKLANKKWRKEESSEDHACNVCCADLDLGSAKNYVTCCTCGKSVCRGPKCSDWRPKDAKWECQLCQSSKESLAHTSSWVAEQMSFNRHKFVYPMRARSEVYIPIVPDGNDSSIQFESVSQIGHTAHMDERAKIREYVEQIVAEMLGDNLDHVKVGQLSKSENYLQLFDKFHAKLSNLLINLENSLFALALRGDLPAIVNGHSNNNNNNNNADTELADLSQTRLRSLIETIIAETLRSSSLSVSGAVSEISLDTRSHVSELANGNGLKRRHRTEHYFEPKIYQDLLATAVLNKIADKEGNTRLVAESTPDLSGRHIDENFNAEALSTTSGSSIEPRSDCSLTDHEIGLDNGKSQSLQADLERESVLSDYIAAHMVPLPDFSASVTESEDDIGSITSGMIGDGNWEDNWLFKKKRSSATQSSVGMLVPAPRENVRAQIGDKTTDEVSDLSEIGSDIEESSLDLLRCNDLNDRLLSQHLIGGQNTKLVLDELVDRTSLTSHTLLEENEPAFTETTNEFVVSPMAVPSDIKAPSPAPPPPPMIFQDDLLNEEPDHTPIAAQGESEELASLDGCTGFSTVEYIDEGQMHETVPSVIEILAAMALGPMLAVPASEQPGGMTPSEMHTLKELSDLALAEINARTVDLVHAHSLDIIEEENTEPSEAGPEQHFELVQQPPLEEITDQISPEEQECLVQLDVLPPPPQSKLISEIEPPPPMELVEDTDSLYPAEVVPELAPVEIRPEMKTDDVTALKSVQIVPEITSTLDIVSEEQSYVEAIITAPTTESEVVHVETGPEIPVPFEIIPNTVVIAYSELHSLDLPEVIHLDSLILEPPDPLESDPETVTTQEHRSEDLPSPMKLNHSLETGFVIGDSTENVSEQIPDMTSEPIAAAQPEPSPIPVPVDSGTQLDNLGTIEVESLKTSVPMETVSEPKIVDPQLPVEADDLTQSTSVNSPEPLKIGSETHPSLMQIDSEPQNIAIDSSPPLEVSEPVKSTPLGGATVDSLQSEQSELPPPVENAVSEGILREATSGDANGSEAVDVIIGTDSIAGKQPQTDETANPSAFVKEISENQPVALDVNVSEPQSISEEGISTIETISLPYPSDVNVVTSVSSGLTEPAPVEPSEPVNIDPQVHNVPVNSPESRESVPESSTLPVNPKLKNNPTIELQNDLVTTSQLIPESESCAINPQASQPVAVDPLPVVEDVTDVVALEPPSLVGTDPETQTMAIESLDPIETIPEPESIIIEKLAPIGRSAEADSIDVENQISPENHIEQQTMSEPQQTVPMDAIQPIEIVQETPCNTSDLMATTEAVDVEHSEPGEDAFLAVKEGLESDLHKSDSHVIEPLSVPLPLELSEPAEAVDIGAPLVSVVSQTQSEPSEAVIPSATLLDIQSQSLEQPVHVVNAAQTEIKEIVSPAPVEIVSTTTEDFPQAEYVVESDNPIPAAEEVQTMVDSTADLQITPIEERPQPSETYSEHADKETPESVEMGLSTQNEAVQITTSVEVTSTATDEATTEPPKIHYETAPPAAEEREANEAVEMLSVTADTTLPEATIPQDTVEALEPPTSIEVKSEVNGDTGSKGNVEVAEPQSKEDEILMEPISMDVTELVDPIQEPKLTLGENPPDTESSERDSQKNTDPVDLQEDNTEAEEKVDTLSTTEVVPDIIVLNPPLLVEPSPEIQAMTTVPLESELIAIEQPVPAKNQESIVVDSQPVVIDTPASAEVLFENEVAPTPQQIPENKSESVAMEPITPADVESEPDSRAVEPLTSTQATPVEVTASEPFDTVVKPVAEAQTPTIENTTPKEITQTVALDSTESLETNLDTEIVSEDLIQVDPKELSAHVEPVSQIEASSGDPQEPAKETKQVEDILVVQATLTQVSVTDSVAVNPSVPVEQSEDSIGDPPESAQNVSDVVPVIENHPASAETSVTDSVAVELNDPVERTTNLSGNTDFVADTESSGADNEIGVDPNNPAEFEPVNVIPETNQLEIETLELKEELTMEELTTIDGKPSAVLEPLVSVNTVYQEESTNLKTETVDVVEVKPVAVGTSAEEKSLENEKMVLNVESTNGEPLPAAESVILEPVLGEEPISVPEYTSVDSGNFVPQLDSVPLSAPAAVTIPKEPKDLELRACEELIPESVSCTDDLPDPAQGLLQEAPVDMETLSGIPMVPDEYVHEFEPSPVEIVLQHADAITIAPVEPNTKPETESPSPMGAISTPDLQVVASVPLDSVPAAPVMPMEFVSNKEHLKEETKDERATPVSLGHVGQKQSNANEEPPHDEDNSKRDDGILNDEEEPVSEPQKDEVVEVKPIVETPVDEESKTITTAISNLSSDVQLACIDQELQEIALDPATEGSIAEREVKKWYNAVEMPNNPYSPEALKQRISGTQERYMDVPNISPSAEQKALASALTENPDPPAPKTDYKRYSRDYYINNAPTATDSTGGVKAATSSALEEVEDIVINEAQKANKPATEQDPPQESVYKATPVQVLDESLDSQSNPSLYSLQTTTTNTSDESNTVRIYDFNKQETTVIRAAPAGQQPSDSTTSSMESAQSALPSASSSNDSTGSNKRERPVVLQFGPADSVPTIGSPASTPTRGSTPPAFRFLQPKRRLIDPSQVLSVDEDDVPETTTPSAEKPVIEDEVAHSMPSVKALAQAFLLTSKHTQPQRRWRAKVRIAAPPETPDKPNTSLAKRHKLEHAVSMAEVADESTIASDLSSLETDPSIHSETNPPVASPASPVPVRHGFLRSNIAFFENLKFK
ncbi:mucin-17 isoform X3 [Drosophila santomea]|uniref:mucin-17 isoform X3 n=1 Tax=Drosophila santomea TaxID=129105 RepID=UPI00195417F5|nr:mucin-17 isoform X3 [Drosophila santomea]